jgi:glucosamine--fructose-6-phosphate aminotransferase (isomerizing)
MSEQRSFLHQEIHQQPQVLAELIEVEWANIARIAQGIRRREPRYIVIAARGSSDNAATYGKYLFATVNRLPVALAAPSLFTLYKQPPDMREALVIGISQSGQSVDIIQVLTEAHRQGAPTLCLTNSPDSPLAKAAEHVILCHAGEERSIAATKTYTTQLVALALLTTALANSGERLAAIQVLPQAVEQTLALEEHIQRGVERYRYMEHCVVIGRGYNYATAFEIALKLKELTYVLAEPYSSADFLHGPIAIVEEGFPVIVVAPRGRTYDDVCRLARDLRGKAAELVVISDQEEASALATTPLPLPVSVEEWLSPVLCVLPGQLFAYHLTLAKGYDPDHPRGLRKVTDAP